MSSLSADHQACADLLRRDDPDRYYACLFAPEDKRGALFALYAFSLELARIREIVSEPMLGEIRMQWWRDALAGDAPGEVNANPVAAALLQAVQTYHLPSQALIDLIEGRSFDLYDDPMPTRRDLEGYCGETCSSLIRLASLVLAEGRDPGGAEACGHAGVAFAITGLLRALPWHGARGQVYLPADVLAQHGVTREQILSGQVTPAVMAVLVELRALARHHVERAMAGAGQMNESARAALLPLAVVPLYLKRMEAGGYEPFRTSITAPLWLRLLAMWNLSRKL
jgi:phytoene synthase